MKIKGNNKFRNPIPNYILIVVFETGFSIGINILFASFLNTPTYGEYVTIFNIAYIISVIFEFGLPVHIQREVSNKSLINKNFSLAIVIKLLCFVPFILIVVLVYILVSSTPDFLLLGILGSSIYLTSINKLLIHYGYGKNDFSSVLFATVNSKAFFLIFLLISLYVLSDNYYVIVLLPTIGLSHFLFLLKNLNININLPQRINFTGIKYLLFSTKYLAIISIILVINDRIDIVLVNYFLGNIDSANYSIVLLSYKFSGVVFSIIWVPALTKFASYKPFSIEFKKSLNKNILSIIGITLVLVLVNLFYVPTALKIIYGTKYNMGIEVIPLMSFLFLCQGFAGLLGAVLNALKQELFVLFAVVFGALSNVLINMKLLEIYGITASIFARNVSDSIIFLIELFCLFLLIRNHNKLNNET